MKGKQGFLNFTRSAKGLNLFERYHPALEYVKKAEEDKLWLEKRKLVGPASTEITMVDSQEKTHQGINFASNNYLGLAQHPFTIEAGAQAG